MNGQFLHICWVATLSAWVSAVANGLSPGDLAADSECESSFPESSERACAVSALQTRAKVTSFSTANSQDVAKGVESEKLLPWNYHAFQQGDWPRMYPLCEGNPNPDHPNNQFQSPIDIPSRGPHEPTDERLSLNGWGCTQAVFQLLHDYLEVNFADAGCTNLTATWKGTTYTLVQLHFHMMSEVQLDGKKFMGEMHMVHSASDGSPLVIGTFLDLPQSAEDMGNGYVHDMFLACTDIVNGLNLSRLVSAYEFGRYDVINPYFLQRAGNKFYSYPGSLTTPPCTPGVEWISMAEPILVSQPDFDIYHAFLSNRLRNGTQNSYGFDGRPPQPLNNRTIVIGEIK
ncbi:unnamed protein product [Polarella glacialis]|uniref:carbonic anhydrase n=1 Tax=Polarella glacialis TaxID=89957 RepID=A0A813IAD7_POLGL|nr:unnamed protein product [Polarella glacialis]